MKQRELLARAIVGRSLDIPLRPRINIGLKVYETDYPMGPPNNPEKVMCKENDLILDNFGLWLSSFFVPGSQNPYTAVSVKDTGNTSRNVSAWGSTSTNVAVSQYQHSVNLACSVGVGTGATAAARTDYNLQTQAGSWTALGGGSAWTSAAGNVTFAGSVFLSAGATVTESGVIVDWNGTDNVSRRVLIFHDVFSGVAIAAGKYAHVAYTIQL